VLLGAALLVCLATVPLLGGRLDALAYLELRARWTLIVALGIQMAIVYVVPDWPGDLLSAGHLASYGFAIWFLVANRGVPGLVIIALGGASNLAAIVANGGVMPASRSALASAGLEDVPGHFASSIAVGHPKLAFLGDVFAVPASFPVHNVFSVGDVCIVLGAFVLLHHACNSVLVRSRTSEFSDLFHNRPFVRSWTAKGISNLGDWTYSLAILTMLAERGTGARSFATLLIAQVGAAAVAGALGGPWIDRLPRRRVMVSADLIRCAAVASLLVVGNPTLAHLYAVAACIGACGALFSPSLQATVPNLVPARRLVAANALLTGTFHLAIMVGPVLGGMMAAAWGPDLAVALNSASFAVSAALIAGVHVARTAPEERMPTGQALLEGFRYAVGTPLVRGVMVVIALVMVAASVRTPLEPVFILHTLAQQPAALGLAAGAWGMGMVLGSGVAPTLCRHWSRQRMLAGAVAVVGVAVAGSSRATSIEPVLGLFAVAGLGNAVAVISYQSLLQEWTPDRLRGRVVAASEAVLDFSLIIGALMAATLAGAFGVRGAMFASGGVFLLAGVLARSMLGPGVVPESPAAGNEMASAATAPSQAPSVTGVLPVTSEAV
jgi:MFS family permease